VLMLKVVLGATLDVASVVKFFGHMSLTSIVMGGLAGLLAVAIIGKCAEERFHNDTMIQIITTLCCAYLSFFVAESELSTSGVLATVSAGFVVAYYAWPRFVSLEAMEAVWETLEFVGNTVIFFLAGLLFADTVLDSLGIIHFSDFGYLLLLYVALLAIRALMLGILWIPLNKVGSPVDMREAKAMIWSGLRGAVSLTLAIIIDEEPLISREMGARIMFHVGGIAALTLLINATTAAPLLRALGLARSSRADEKKLAVLSKHLADHTAHAMATAKMDKTDLRFTGADEAILKQMVPALSQEVTEEVSGEAGSETAQAYREAFLNVVKNHYWSAIRKSILPRTSQSARLLLNSVDVAMDSSSEILADWAFIREALEAPKTSLSRLAGEYSMDETMQKSYCVLSFLEAHRNAREELPRFFHNDSVEVQDLVAAESTAEVLEATRLLQTLPENLVTLARTEMLARKLLQEQLDEVAELKEQGLLTASDASKLDHRVQGSLLTLLRKPKDQWLQSKAATADL
ncbi:NHX7, partial [Symbiodinium pilosum]